MRNTKFVFHTSQTQSKEEIVLDRQQFSVFFGGGDEKKRVNFYITTTMLKVLALEKNKTKNKHFNQPKLDLLI